MSSILFERDFCLFLRVEICFDDDDDDGVVLGVQHKMKAFLCRKKRMADNGSLESFIKVCFYARFLLLLYAGEY